MSGGASDPLSSEEKIHTKYSFAESPGNRNKNFCVRGGRHCKTVPRPAAKRGWRCQLRRVEALEWDVDRDGGGDLIPWRRYRVKLAPWTALVPV